MDDIRDTAAKFLANRMKTKDQLKKHLQKKNFEESDIADILAQFESAGYLDDIDYAAVYISHRIPKGYTFRRITRELSELGVSREQSEAGLARFIEEQGYDPTAVELERGREQAHKILGNAIPADSKLLAKAGRKLMSLGYQPETIYAILGEYMRGVKE